MTRRRLTVHEEQRVVDALLAAAPLPDLDPLPVTAEQLRERADQGLRLRQRTRLRLRTDTFTLRPHWRLRLASAITTITAIATGLGVVLNISALSPGTTTPPIVLVAATPGMLNLPETSVDAKPWLLSIIQLTSELPATPTGPVTYTHLQSWYLDTTDTDTATADNIIASDQQIWWKVNRTATICRTQLAKQASGNRIAAYLDPPPVTTACRQDGQVNPPDAPGADLDILIRDLTPPHPGPPDFAAFLRALADLNDYYAMQPAQRATVLAALATVTDLKYRGRVDDRAGRNGWAFSLDSITPAGAIQDVIVIDPRAGQILSQERIALTTPEKAAFIAPAVTSYTIYLQTATTATMP